ncbi:unnamed protein product, partial [Didymodactylos carnosus]
MIVRPSIFINITSRALSIVRNLRNNVPQPGFVSSPTVPPTVNIPDPLLNRGVIYEPPYLFETDTYPNYSMLAITMRGYDYVVLEGFFRYVEKVAKSLDVNVLESVAVPSKSSRVTILKPRSQHVDVEYTLNLYHRIVKLSKVKTTIAPIIFECIRLNIPEGVELKIGVPDIKDDAFRYVPDVELKQLQSEMDAITKEKEDKEKMKYLKREQKQKDKNQAMLLSILSPTLVSEPLPITSNEHDEKSYVYKKTIMDQLILTELDSDSFDVDNLIENVAYKAVDGNITNQNFDLFLLEDKFRKAMSILQAQQVLNERTIKQLQDSCEQERQTWSGSVAQLEELYQNAYTDQQELEMRISVISTKVIQIGHQLESKSNPRQQLVEARTTAKYLERFLDANDDVIGLFHDISKLEQAAHVIHQLYNVLQELPDEPKFIDAKTKVKERYMAIEEMLLQEFSRAQVRNDKKTMKKYIKLLSKFKGHNDCVQNFITDCLKGYFDNPNIDIFDAIPQLFIKVSELINELFDQPEKVIEKLIITVYTEKLAPYVRTKLEPYEQNPDLENMEKYLQTLYLLNKKASKLSNDLQTQKISDDPAFLHKLNQHVFKVYLKSYSKYELNCLEEKFQLQLERIEGSSGGQRRIKQAGLTSITDIIQQRLLSTNDQVDESRFSSELGAVLLDDCKTSMNRIAMLSEGFEASENICQCFLRLLNALCVQHVEIELQFSLSAIPGNEPRQEPDIKFFHAILQTNNIIQLVERYFVFNVAPLLTYVFKDLFEFFCCFYYLNLIFSGTQQQSVILQTKEKIMNQLEELINTGVD